MSAEQPSGEKQKLREKVKMIEQVASDPEKIFGLTGYEDMQEMSVALVQVVGLLELLQETYI